MSKRREIVYECLGYIVMILITIAAVWYICTQFGCASQTAMTGLKDTPTATVTTQIPTTQSAVAGGDANIEGPKTKTTTVIGVPWYGIAVLAGVGVVGLVGVIYAQHRWGYHKGNWDRKRDFVKRIEDK